MKLPRKRHKYGAVPTVVDNIRFASKAEAKRYGELKLLERAGKIRDLALQPKFALRAGSVEIGHYIGDFMYLDLDTGNVVVEDCKGFETPMFKWKRKHFEAQMGIKITIVGRNQK